MRLTLIRMFALSATLVLGGAGLVRSSLVRDDLDQRQASYSQALDLSLTELKSQALPARGLLTRVAKVTGATLKQLQQARLYRAQADAELVWLCELDSQSQRVLVCTDATGSLSRGVVLAADEQVSHEWMRLFAQFRQRPALILDEAKSHAEFEARRAQVERGTSAEDRLAAALLDQRYEMVEILGLFMRASGGLQAGQDVSSDLTQMGQQFEAYAQNAGPLAELLGDRADQYSDLAQQAAQGMRAASQASRAGESALPIIRELQTACGACHELQVAGAQAGLQEHAASVRADLGIGSGYYLLGFDLVQTSQAAQREQELANVVRSSLLLVSEAVSQMSK